MIYQFLIRLWKQFRFFSIQEIDLDKNSPEKIMPYVHIELLRTIRQREENKHFLEWMLKISEQKERLKLEIPHAKAMRQESKTRLHWNLFISSPALSEQSLRWYQSYYRKQWKLIVYPELESCVRMCWQTKERKREMHKELVPISSSQFKIRSWKKISLPSLLQKSVCEWKRRCVLRTYWRTNVCPSISMEWNRRIFEKDYINWSMRQLDVMKELYCHRYFKRKLPKVNNVCQSTFQPDVFLLWVSRIYLLYLFCWICMGIMIALMTQDKILDLWIHWMRFHHKFMVYHYRKKILWIYLIHKTYYYPPMKRPPKIVNMTKRYWIHNIFYRRKI